MLLALGWEMLPPAEFSRPRKAPGEVQEGPPRPAGVLLQSDAAYPLLRAGDPRQGAAKIWALDGALWEA